MASISESSVGVIIKLGGSAITDKSQLETAKLAEIAKGADIVKKCGHHGLKCIVVHGGG